MAMTASFPVREQAPGPAGASQVSSECAPVPTGVLLVASQGPAGPEVVAVSTVRWRRVPPSRQG
ncbi:hypothetical protein ADK59_18775 [Streptomyces sp. XY332]|nr:hypothetical protein ADK59_18775 [Streptomyces sp. XY332]